MPKASFPASKKQHGAAALRKTMQDIAGLNLFKRYPAYVLLRAPVPCRLLMLSCFMQQAALCTVFAGSVLVKKYEPLPVKRSCL